MNIQKATNACDQVMRFSFCAMIYFLPISIAIVESFTGIIITTYFTKRSFLFCDRLKNLPQRAGERTLLGRIKLFFQSFAPVQNILTRPITFFVLINFLTIFISHDTSLSIRGFMGKVFPAAFLFFSFIECMNHRKYLKVFVAVLLISFTLIGINGLVQYFTGEGFIFGHNLDAGRIKSSLRHPNDFAAYLMAGIFLSFNFFLMSINKRFQNHRKFLFILGMIILFFLGIVCLGLTYSRAAWLSFMIAMILWGMMNRKILIAVAIAFIFFVMFTPRMQEVRDVTLLSEQTYRSGAGRSGFWREALNIIKDYPILGIGVNTYSVVGKDYKINWGGYPHNSYLQMGAEIGLIGLGAFLWIIFELFYHARKAFGRSQDLFINYTLTGVSTGLFAFLLHSFFDTQFYSVQLGALLWILIGFLVAVQRLVGEV